MLLRKAIIQFGLSLIIASTALSAIASDIEKDPPLTIQSLSHIFENGFLFGAAVNRKQMTGQDTRSGALIQQHFNVLTPENDMKWSNIQAQQGIFTFDGADALIAYAKQHSQHVIGHVLVWHEQTPDWLFLDERGNTVTREELLNRMKTHIFALAGRYKGDITGWDVVNEALNEDGSLRRSKWLEIIGEEFIDYAFLYASQAAPDAELYYNDYNLFKVEKMTGALNIAKRLRDKGIRIDGIGAQGHYGLNPPVSQLETSIQRVIANELSFIITELDITVLKFPDEKNMGADVSLNFELVDEYNPYKDGLDAQTYAKLAESYVDLFRLFWKYREHIDRVTLWGVSDGDSWRNYWPMQGRTDYPLLFDRQYQAKPFVFELAAIAQKNN